MSKSKLDAAREGLEKLFGKGATIQGNEVVAVKRMSTGSLSLDIVTGGGYGEGRIVEIYGAESSGKTTLTIHAMVEAQNNGGKVAFIDAEHAFDSVYAGDLGLNMAEVILAQPDNGEQALQIAETLIATGEISIAVVDSVAALVPQAEIDGEFGESKMGLQARLMSQAMRKLVGVVNKTGTLLIFTNQTRDKIGVVYGNPSTTTGGNALKFYASTRLEVSKNAGNKDKDGNVLDSLCKVKVVKNKLAPPFRTCEFDIVFGEGISRESEVVKIGCDLGFIEKSGSWYAYQGTKIGQGEANVKQLLRDNPELSLEIENKIRTHFNLPLAK